MRKFFAAISAVVVIAGFSAAARAGLSRLGFNGLGLSRAKADWNYITLSKYYLHPGQTVSVFGDGFGAGENIEITVAGLHQNIQADGSGKFNSGGFTIPYSVIGQTIPVVASGNSGHTSTANLVVGTYYPHVEPSSYYIVPGGSVRFFGKNFGPNETVRITGSNVDTTATTDGSGSFVSESVQVPYVSGSQRYSFAGQTSGTTDTVTLHISGTNPVVILNDYYGPSGSSVKITGRFYGYNEKVAITSGGHDVGSAATDSNGNFSTTITIPESSALSVQNITATGETTGKTAAPAKFTIAWNNEDQNSGGKTQNAGVSVTVDSVDKPTTTLTRGQNFTATSNLKATGGTARDVTVTVKLANPGNLASIQQANTNQTLRGNMVTGFQLQATGGMPASMYTLSTVVQNPDMSTLANFPNIGTIEVR